MKQTKCYVIDTRMIRKDIASKLASRGTIVKVAGLSFILLAGIDGTALASSGIDEQANKLYVKLLNVGKWVIVFKGAIDTIKNVAEGDFQAAKKHSLGYFVTYAILWALPWGLNEVDHLFSELNAGR